MSLQSGYARQSAIDALREGFVESGVDEALAEQFATRAVDATIAYAREVALGGGEAALLARIANLRAALASIEARADREAGYQAVHFPVGAARVGFANLRAASRGALEADDRAAHPMRILAADTDGNTTITERPTGEVADLRGG